RISRRTVVWSCAAYLVFLATWGFNYRRVRVVERLQFDAAAVTIDAARRVAAAIVDDVNRLHGAAHARGWADANTIDRELASALGLAIERVEGVTRLAGVARPKRTLLGWYFLRAGGEALTDPSFLG